MTRSLHPFPARMAPEIVAQICEELKPKSVVLDPMSGSGTVVTSAAKQGHTCHAYDLDPLSVLITRVATQEVDADQVRVWAERLLARAAASSARNVHLPWIDDDPETSDFTRYWFGNRQRGQLRRIAHHLRHLHGPSSDALRVALSRIIITKNPGVSLARDASHSRPHRTVTSTDVDVFQRFEASVEWVASFLENRPCLGEVNVHLGDARALDQLSNDSIDTIITSPPYLNAIDYIRGHRLSLVWFGHTIGDARSIRRSSVGAEISSSAVSEVVGAVLGKETGKLSSRHRGFVERYFLDMSHVLEELARVLKDDGHLIMVVGNSSLRGAFVRNNRLIREAAARSGLRLIKEVRRRLPPNRRYLPPPSSSESALAFRMRTESVMRFEHDH